MRLVKIESMAINVSILLQELDGGLSIDMSKIADEVSCLYEVLDERKDRGEYYHHE